MNQEYKAFNANDPTGSIGTYIRVTGDTKVYCHEGCYSGYADCRVSGMVFNPTQIIDPTTGGIAWEFVGTESTGDYLGFWVNQTLIKERLGKCAYILDGGTDNKYNMGCGKAAACNTHDCDDKTCAYASRDPATDYTTYANGESECVQGGMYPADECLTAFCGYKGASFYKETGLIPDETFKVLKFRADDQDADTKPKWNEFVLDGELMLQELQRNPAGTIPAIVYVSTFPGDGKAAATAMAQKMADDWNMQAPVPVIKVDLSVDVVSGGSPFVFEEAEDIIA